MINLQLPSAETIALALLRFEQRQKNILQIHDRLTSIDLHAVAPLSRWTAKSVVLVVGLITCRHCQRIHQAPSENLFLQLENAQNILWTTPIKINQVPSTLPRYIRYIEHFCESCLHCFSGAEPESAQLNLFELTPVHITTWVDKDNKIHGFGSPVVGVEQL